MEHSLWAVNFAHPMDTKAQTNKQTVNPGKGFMSAGY